MNLFRKIGRALTALAMALLSGLETRERSRRLEERIKRCEEKQKHSHSANN